jgi:MFS family permease
LNRPESPPGTVSRAEFLNLFLAVFLPMAMAAADQTLLATATPAIAATLGGLRDTSWIMVGYLLASATIVPVYGRLGDVRGRREVLLVALGVSRSARSPAAARRACRSSSRRACSRAWAAAG